MRVLIIKPCGRTEEKLAEQERKLAEQERKLAEQERKRREALTLGDFQEHGEETRGYVELLFTMDRETARRKAQEFGWAWNDQSMKDLEQDALERIEMLEGRR